MLFQYLAFSLLSFAGSVIAKATEQKVFSTGQTANTTFIPHSYIVKLNDGVTSIAHYIDV